MKKQKGITLVALVVTIVVLLILASVSIAMLRGDSGIISNAQKSKYANIEAEVKDKMLLSYNSVKTEIKVKQATESRYKATTHISDFVDMIEEDLNNDTEYSVSTDGNDIIITYSDADFEDNSDGDGKASGAKYRAIKCTITISDTDATLVGPNKQVGN